MEQHSVLISLVLDLAILSMAGLFVWLPYQHRTTLQELGFSRLITAVQVGIAAIFLFFLLDLFYLLKLPFFGFLNSWYTGEIVAFSRVEAITSMGLIGAALFLVMNKVCGKVGSSIRTLEDTQNKLQAELVKREQLEQIIRDRHLLETEELHYELSVQREFIDAFFDSAPTGLAILDHKGHLLKVNKTLTREIGAEERELIGRSLENALPQIAKQLPKSVQSAGGLTQRVITKEITLQRRDNSSARLAITCFPISVEPESKKPGWGLILVDVEAQRQLEERLRQAQKLEAIGRLAGGVAHDFNNLLMVVQFASDRLQRIVGENEKAHIELRDIIKATESAGALTRQLLAFSRMQVLEPRTVNLQRALNEIKLLLERSLGSNIKVDIKVDERIVIRVDPVQLDLIVLNLAINARDAMPGGGRLSISCDVRRLNSTDINEGEVIHAGEYAVMSVADTGKGMDQDTLELIFEPFFTTKGRHEGTGLGLATVHGIVAQSGGTIRVKSQPSQGTTFEVFFPVVTNKEDEEVVQAEPVHHVHENKRILLVEDEPKVLDLMSMSLTDAGHTVMEATSSKQALEIAYAEEGSFDLLLTDVVLPGISGLDLANRITGEYSKIPVLMVSGYTAENIEVREIADSPYYFMQKPFQPIELVNKVNQILLETQPQTSG